MTIGISGFVNRYIIIIMLLFVHNAYVSVLFALFNAFGLSCSTEQIVTVSSTCGFCADPTVLVVHVYAHTQPEYKRCRHMSTSGFP